MQPLAWFTWLMRTRMPSRRERCCLRSQLSTSAGTCGLSTCTSTLQNRRMTQHQDLQPEVCRGQRPGSNVTTEADRSILSRTLAAGMPHLTSTSAWLHVLLCRMTFRAAGLTR